MAANDDFTSWLTEELRVERAVLREQQQNQYAMLERRHSQLLAEMRAKLCKTSGDIECEVKESTPNNETRPVPEKERPATETMKSVLPSPPLLDALDTGKSDTQPLTSPLQQAAASRQDTASPESKSQPGPLASRGSMGSRESQSYKSKALKTLARQGSEVANEEDPLIKRIVKNPWFEAVSGTLIMTNVLLLAVEIEYYGFDSGQSVGYKNYQSADETWPGMKPWLEYLDYIFVGFFILELILRIAADPRKSIVSGWIWFDAIIIIASFFSWLELGAGSSNLDPTLLRMARISRMMRGLKMIRIVRAFDSLFLLLRSIQASVGALFWSFMLLIAVQVAIGMCLSQSLRIYIQDDAHNSIKRREVFLLYGTFTRTMLTMFEITLGNWVPSCRILMNNVSEWFALFYILYCCCFIFAVIRVIQAVFIAETNRLVAADDQVALMRKQKDKELYLKKVRTMFQELDTSGDGQLSREEVAAVSNDKLLKTMMSTLDIGVHDLEALFDLLDDGDGQIDIDEFIKGLSRVKGGAQAIDVVSLLKLAQKLDGKTDNILEKLDHTTMYTLHI